MGIVPNLRALEVLLLHCPLCSFHTHFVHQLEVHFNAKHSSKTVDYNLYQCSICAKVSSSKVFLHEHIQLIHHHKFPKFSSSSDSTALVKKSCTGVDAIVENGHSSLSEDHEESNPTMSPASTNTGDPQGDEHVFIKVLFAGQICAGGPSPSTPSKEKNRSMNSSLGTTEWLGVHRQCLFCAFASANPKCLEEHYTRHGIRQLALAKSGDTSRDCNRSLETGSDPITVMDELNQLANNKTNESHRLPAAFMTPSNYSLPNGNGSVSSVNSSFSSEDSTDLDPRPSSILVNSVKRKRPASCEPNLSFARKRKRTKSSRVKKSSKLFKPLQKESRLLDLEEPTNAGSIHPGCSNSGLAKNPDNTDPKLQLPSNPLCFNPFLLSAFTSSSNSYWPLNALSNYYDPSKVSLPFSTSSTGTSQSIGSRINNLPQPAHTTPTNPAVSVQNSTNLLTSSTNKGKHKSSTLNDSVYNFNTLSPTEVKNCQPTITNISPPATTIQTSSQDQSTNLLNQQLSIPPNFPLTLLSQTSLSNMTPSNMLVNAFSAWCSSQQQQQQQSMNNTVPNNLLTNGVCEGMPNLQSVPNMSGLSAPINSTPTIHDTSSNNNSIITDLLNSNSHINSEHLMKAASSVGGSNLQYHKQSQLGDVLSGVSASTSLTLHQHSSNNVADSGKQNISPAPLLFDSTQDLTTTSSFSQQQQSSITVNPVSTENHMAALLAAAAAAMANSCNNASSSEQSITPMSSGVTRPHSLLIPMTNSMPNSINNVVESRTNVSGHCNERGDHEEEDGVDECADDTMTEDDFMHEMLLHSSSNGADSNSNVRVRSTTSNGYAHDDESDKQGSKQSESPPSTIDTGKSNCLDTTSNERYSAKSRSSTTNNNSDVKIGKTTALSEQNASASTHPSSDDSSINPTGLFNIRRAVGLSRTNLPFPARKRLFSWLVEHLNEPYPSEEEKMMLAMETNLSRTTVNNWFINARRRYVKPLLQGRLVLQSGVFKTMSGDNCPASVSPPSPAVTSASLFASSLPIASSHHHSSNSSTKSTSQSPAGIADGHPLNMSRSSSRRVNNSSGLFQSTTSSLFNHQPVESHQAISSESNTLLSPSTIASSLANKTQTESTLSAMAVAAAAAAALANQCATNTTTSNNGPVGTFHQDQHHHPMLPNVFSTAFNSMLTSSNHLLAPRLGATTANNTSTGNILLNEAEKLINKPSSGFKLETTGSQDT